MTDPTEHMEKVTQGMIQACDDVHTNCSKSVDALVEAGTAVSKGCEEFGRNWGSLVQKSLANALSTSKTMMSARSFKEVSDLQTEFMKEFFDSWMAGAGRLSEISSRVTQQAFEPVAKHAQQATRAA